MVYVMLITFLPSSVLGSGSVMAGHLLALTFIYVIARCFSAFSSNAWKSVKILNVNKA